MKKFLRARAGIEPVIGHLKTDHKLVRNYLRGKIDDGINAIMTGAGLNLRKIFNFYKNENMSKWALAGC